METPRTTIIHYGDLEEAPSVSPGISLLYELTETGPIDRTHSLIHATISNEKQSKYNGILSSGKVYLVLFSCTDRWSPEYLKMAELAKYLRDAQRNPQKIQTRYSSFSQLCHARLEDKERVNRWRTSPSRSISSDFYFNAETYINYSSFIDGFSAIVVRPDNMPEETLNTALAMYGGLADFDIRPLIALEKTGSDLLNMLLASKSFKMPIPLFCTASALLPLMSFIHENTEAMRGDQNGEDTRFPAHRSNPKYPPGASLLRRVHSMVRYLQVNWATLVTSFAPEKLVSLLKDSSKCHSDDWHSILNQGRESSPSVSKKTVSVTAEDKLYTREGQSHAGFLNGFLQEIEEIDNEVDNTDCGLCKSLWTYCYQNGSRLARILNSTTQLSMDLRKSIEVELDPMVRWKGSRKQGEKELASAIFLAKCMLRDPSVLSACLRHHFWGKLQYGGSCSLLKLGLVLEKFYGKGVVLNSGTEKRFQFYGNGISTRRFFKQANNNIPSRGANRICKDLAIIHSILPNTETYTRLLQTYFALLNHIVMSESSNAQVALHAGIQTSDSWTLLKGTIELDEISNVGDINLRLSSLPVYVFNVESNHFLEDLYIILENRGDYIPRLNPDASEIIRNCIDTLQTIRATTVLPIADSYTLNLELKDFLVHSKWAEVLEDIPT